jgi:hypothetical protein
VRGAHARSPKVSRRVQLSKRRSMKRTATKVCPSTSRQPHGSVSLPQPLPVSRIGPLPVRRRTASWRPTTATRIGNDGDPTSGGRGPPARSHLHPYPLFPRPILPFFLALPWALWFHLFRPPRSDRQWGTVREDYRHALHPAFLSPVHALPPGRAHPVLFSLMCLCLRLAAAARTAPPGRIFRMTTPVPGLTVGAKTGSWASRCAQP